MKKIITLMVILTLLTGITACISTDKKEAGYTPPVAPAKTVGPMVVFLDEPVTDTSCNNLAETIGPVTITIDKDTSYTSNDSIYGATIRLVEFLGKKAIEVTRNDANEIRVAFVLKTPTALAGYSTLSYSVLGLEGSGGVYNCGLLYTDAKGSEERLGSFYVSPVLPKEWTAVEANLVKDEVWGNNFSQDRVLYCIQFWTNQAMRIYITDLSLR